MTRRDISDGVGNISARHIQEAANYQASEKKVGLFKKPFGRAMIAAVLTLCVLTGGIRIFVPFGGMVVTAYAQGTDEELTQAGAVIHTGTISDSGEMTGHPLMFYLSGKDISTVRFSCKNQQINFMDWTETRDEFGLAQNFTVSYGQDASEYYYLLIDWVPNATIRALTDNANSSISTLPKELREDVIVMEIVFENGKALTKAITVSLLDDGTFFAAFQDYEITPEDTFVARADSESIPRDVLYGQGDSPVWGEEYSFGDAPMIENSAQDADPNEPETSLDPLADDALEAAKIVAEAYYENTVFEVISMEPKDQTAKEIAFSVRVSKGGTVQEPDRVIFLELTHGQWEVVNEGY